MAGPPYGVPLANLSFALSAGCMALWAILLTSRRISRITTRIRLAVGGQAGQAGQVGRQAAGGDVSEFSTRNEGRPDPWLENVLRGAFAEFDRELRKIMPRLYPREPDDN
jgi:hypothetical protein